MPSVNAQKGSLFLFTPLCSLAALARKLKGMPALEKKTSFGSVKPHAKCAAVEMDNFEIVTLWIP